MSRAAIFTSTALALPACGGSKHEPDPTVLVAPASDAAQVALVESADAEPAPLDAGAPVPVDAPAPAPDAAVVAKSTKGNAKLYGTLRDSNGHAAPGYPLTLFAASSYPSRAAEIGAPPGVYYEATTTGKGTYVFGKMPAGTYVLEIEGAASPHSSPHTESVTLQGGESLKLDLTLYPPRPCCMPYGAPPARRRTV